MKQFDVEDRWMRRAITNEWTEYTTLFLITFPEPIRASSARLASSIVETEHRTRRQWTREFNGVRVDSLRKSSEINKRTQKRFIDSIQIDSWWDQKIRWLWNRISDEKTKQGRNRRRAVFTFSPACLCREAENLWLAHWFSSRFPHSLLFGIDKLRYNKLESASLSGLPLPVRCDLVHCRSTSVSSAQLSVEKPKHPWNKPCRRRFSSLLPTTKSPCRSEEGEIGQMLEWQTGSSQIDDCHWTGQW